MAENEKKAGEMIVDKKPAKEKKSLLQKLKDYVKNLFDFSNFDKKTLLFMIIFTFIIVLTVWLFLYMIFVDDTFLYRIIIDWVVNPIWQLGFWGIFLFIIIMMLQGIIAPIPSEVVLLAAGMIYRLALGSILGIVGSMAAGMLCFYISKKGGRPMAEKFIGENTLDMIDDLIAKYGTAVIFMGRVLPFVPFDPISFASGVLEIDTKKYALATFIGVIPRVLFYCFLGDALAANLTYPVVYSEIDPDQFGAQADLFNMILVIIAVVMVVGFGAIILLSKIRERKMGKSKVEGKEVSKVSVLKRNNLFKYYGFSNFNP